MRLPRLIALAASAIAAVFLFGCMSQQERSALLNGPYTVQVDYAQSVEDLLSAGQYTWVQHQVSSSNFPSTEAGEGTLSAVLVPFSPQADLGYVLGTAPAGMRPATLKELLAFGETYRDIQRKVPILALGSSARLEVPTYRLERTGDPTRLPIMIVTPRVEQLYPVLADGLPGRAVNLEWLGSSGGYGMYYALFVKQG